MVTQSGDFGGHGILRSTAQRSPALEGHKKHQHIKGSEKSCGEHRKSKHRASLSVSHRCHFVNLKEKSSLSSPKPTSDFQTINIDCMTCFTPATTMEAGITTMNEMDTVLTLRDLAFIRGDDLCIQLQL